MNLSNSAIITACPLTLLTWHAYSTDPKCEKEMTAYNKTSIALMRDWLNLLQEGTGAFDSG